MLSVQLSMFLQMCTSVQPPAPSVWRSFPSTLEVSSLSLAVHPVSITSHGIYRSIFDFHNNLQRTERV